MCVLRAFGDEFDPAEFLRTLSIGPYSTYRRGDRRFKSSESAYETSGFKVEGGVAEWTLTPKAEIGLVSSKRGTENAFRH
jgi:hypothetical protein